jgi:iron complex transport system substrate-binding protein
MRICSLLPSATEIAFALGLGEQVVAVSHECDYPAEAQHKTVVVRSRIDSNQMTSSGIDSRVGEILQTRQSLYAIEEDAFRQAAPDVILTQGLCDVCALDYNDVLQAAQSLSYEPTILSLTPSCLTDVLDDILRVGDVTERRREAETLVRDLRQRVERVRQQAEQSLLRPRIACIEWLDPIYAAGHWVPELVALAGGVDVLGRKGKPSAKVEWITVVKSAPEIIVLMPCGFDVERTIRESVLLQKLAGWNHLPAVASGNVYAVNGSAFFSRPGPRLVDGLEVLAQIIHPEIFREPSRPNAVQRIL